MKDLFIDYDVYKERVDVLREKIQDISAERTIYLKATEISDMPKSKILPDITCELALKHIRAEDKIKFHLIELEKALEILNKMDCFLLGLCKKDRELIEEVFVKHECKDYLSHKYKVTIGTLDRWVRLIFKEPS